MISVSEWTAPDQWETEAWSQAVSGTEPANSQSVFPTSASPSPATASTRQSHLSREGEQHNRWQFLPLHDQVIKHHYDDCMVYM